MQLVPNSWGSDSEEANSAGTNQPVQSLGERLLMQMAARKRRRRRLTEVNHCHGKGSGHPCTGGVGADGLTAQRSGYSFEGTLYRAVNSTDGGAALGRGLYLTVSKEDAQGYGSDVRAYTVRLRNVLGVNSPEHERVTMRARATDAWLDEGPGEAVAQMAKRQGYDAIYAGPTYGLVVFDPKGKVSEVRR